jgi:hypothetical protein
MPATALPVGLQPTERSMAILARTRRGATRYFMTPPDWQTSEPLSGYLADSLSGPGYWVFAYKDSLRRPVTPKGAVELGTFPVVQDAEGRDCVIIPPHLYGQLWITPHSPADQTLLAVDGEAGVAFLSVPTNWHDDAIVTAHTLRYVERDQRLALLVREGETSRTAQQLASAVKIGDVHLANVDGEPDCIVLTTPLWERMRPFVSRAERSRSRPPVANDATSEAPIVEDSVGDPLGTDRPALPEGGDFRL